jgi:phenylacetate-CoA ligase
MGVNLEDSFYPWLGTYERLSPGVKRVAGAVFRHVPERLRLGPRFESFRLLANASEDWSEDQAAQYQLGQLRQVLTHAARYSPFYAERFAEAGFEPSRLQSFDDLENCPLLTREDIAHNLDSLLTTNPGRSARLYLTTGGTTGAPIAFYLQKGVSRPKERAFIEALWARAGYLPGARVVMLRSRVTSSSPHGEIAYFDSTRNWLMLSSFHLSAERLPEYLAHVSRFRPEILHVYPSVALHLAGLLEQAGEAWPVPLRCLLAGSELLTTPQRHLLEETFGCPVYHWYGHRERVVLAGQGRKDQLLYFCPAYGFAELGAPDDDGLCEVIGTSFHNLVMPLVRYRTGDYVLPYDESTDGRRELPWLAVSSVRGRGHEFLIGHGGRKIPLTPFNLNDPSFYGLYAVQFFQDRPGQVELRYVPSPRFTAASLERVRALVQRKLGEDFTLVVRRVHDVEATERGKSKWLVSTITSRRVCA